MAEITRYRRAVKQRCQRQVIAVIQVRNQDNRQLRDTQWSLVFINCVMLLTGYVLAYFLKPQDRQKMFGFGQVVKRIVPLHLIPALVFFVDWSVLLFLGLKFAADIVAESLVLNPAFVKKYVRKRA